MMRAICGDEMRDQYAGDVSDAVKFALLRALAAQDRQLGVAWYYVPSNDGRPDGRHTEWLDDPTWATIDRDLQAALTAIPIRSVASLETCPIWPEGTLFHSDPVPSADGRLQWALQMRQKLAEADLVFLDPDNGIGNRSVKHATWGEVRSLVRNDRCTTFITFPGRTLHDEQADRLHQLVKAETHCRSVVTIRTSIAVPATKPGAFVPRARWFTLINPCTALLDRLAKFEATINAQPRMSASIWT